MEEQGSFKSEVEGSIPSTPTIYSMHSKTKGTIGELAVYKSLYEQGHAVFVEIGDNHKVDLISICPEGRLSKIQVKAISSHNDGNTVEVPLRSCGPSYTYSYTSDDIDVLAVYILDLGEVFFIPIEEFGDGKSLSFSISPEYAEADKRRTQRVIQNFKRV